MLLLVCNDTTDCVVRSESGLRLGNSFLPNVSEPNMTLLVGRSAIFLFGGTHPNHGVAPSWLVRYQDSWAVSVIISGWALVFTSALTAFSFSIWKVAVLPPIGVFGVHITAMNSSISNP